MKYLKIFEDFERSAYTKISPKTLIIGNKYLQEKYPYLNMDLYDEVDVIPGGNFLCDDNEFTCIQDVIDYKHEYYKINILDPDHFTIENGVLNTYDSNVQIDYKNLDKIPFKFGRVDGYFSIENNNITSLKGSPQYVTKDFMCGGNKLVDLVGAPNFVGGSIWAEKNKLSTLKGMPEHVGGIIRCFDNELVSIDYLPKDFDNNLYYTDYNKPMDFSNVPSHLLKNMKKWR